MHDQFLLLVTHSKWPGFWVVLCENTARNERKDQHPKTHHCVHFVVGVGAFFFDKKPSLFLTVTEHLPFSEFCRLCQTHIMSAGQPRGKGLQSQLCSLNKLSSCWHGILFSLRPVSQYHLIITGLKVVDSAYCSLFQPNIILLDHFGESSNKFIHRIRLLMLTLKEAQIMAKYVTLWNPFIVKFAIRWYIWWTFPSIVDLY